MAKADIIAFRADERFRSALDKAAMVHGTDRSVLMRSWLEARMVAEGFLQEDGDDQTGNEGVDDGGASGAGDGRSPGDAEREHGERVRAAGHG
jgi:hypothetical protein